VLKSTDWLALDEELAAEGEAAGEADWAIAAPAATINDRATDPENTADFMMRSSIGL
jgi:hypothetical protein